jgi:hypothetical protein
MSGRSRGDPRGPHTGRVEEHPNDDPGRYGQAQPGDVMVFLALLGLGIVGFVALLYGFFFRVLVLPNL